jgi:hypothetical protein
MTVDQLDNLIKQGVAVSIQNAYTLEVAKLKLLSREDMLAFASNGRTYDMTDLELYHE